MGTKNDSPDGHKKRQSRGLLLIASKTIDARSPLANFGITVVYSLVYASMDKVYVVRGVVIMY